MKEEKDRGEVVLYQPNDTIRLEVKLEQETVWLTQQQIADLFGTKRQAITKHLANIFAAASLKKIQLVPFWNILPPMENPIRPIFTTLTPFYLLAIE